MKDQKENISEYIIQTYRQEDLVRVFEFDLEKIGEHVINHLPVSNIEKLSQVNFYEELIGKMKAQGIEKIGHLSEINSLVKNLEEINSDLLTHDTDYQKIYAEAKKSIDDNIKLAKGQVTSEIQICLNGIYGFLLIKLNGKKLDENNQSKVVRFGNVLSYLSSKYSEISDSN
ncbi:MAG: DUF4924 family protein [Cyclobacteriaceae bacterium]